MKFRSWIWRLLFRDFLVQVRLELLLQRTALGRDALARHEELLALNHTLAAKLDRLQAIVEPVAPRLRSAERPPVQDWEETQRRNLTQFEENN